MAAAMAARTSRASILLAALVLTLRDPVAVAEEAIVVDILSGGLLAILLAAVPGPNPFRTFEDVEAVRQLGLYSVVTPDECVQLATSLDPRSSLIFKPLIAGLDPDVGWSSLQPFADRVLPALQGKL
jgi:hypothetical protein